MRNYLYYPNDKGAGLRPFDIIFEIGRNILMEIQKVLT